MNRLYPILHASRTALLVVTAIFSFGVSNAKTDNVTYIDENGNPYSISFGDDATETGIIEIQNSK